MQLDFLVCWIESDEHIEEFSRDRRRKLRSSISHSQIFNEII